MEAQLQMNEGRENRKWQSDGEIADEGEVNVAENGADRAAGRG
jgi:hypothetical protein